MKKANRFLIEDNNLLKDENIKKYKEFMEKQYLGLFTFGKQIDIQKKIGWE